MIKFMSVLSRSLMEKLQKFQIMNLALVYEIKFADTVNTNSYGCRNQCSGSCEGDCEGSCDSSCYGGCSGSFGYD